MTGLQKFWRQKVLIVCWDYEVPLIPLAAIQLSMYLSLLQQLQLSMYLSLLQQLQLSMYLSLLQQLQLSMYLSLLQQLQLSMYLSLLQQYNCYSDATRIHLSPTPYTYSDAPRIHLSPTPYIQRCYQDILEPNPIYTAMLPGYT